MGKKDKVTFIHSISFKVTLMVALTSMFCILVNMLNVSRKAEQAVGNSNDAYVLSMAKNAAQTISNLPPNKQTDTVYEEVLSMIHMEGVDSSYSYLVDAQGTVLYHPTADKIGQQVENEQILNVVSQLQAGKEIQDTVIQYDFHGVDKCAAYAVTKTDMIVVVTVDKKEIMKPVDEIISSMFFLSLISILLCIVAGYVVSKLICIPIERLTVIISDTAQLNFKRNAHSASLRKRRDESGKMARAIHQMRKQLRQMLQNIETAGGQITSNVQGLQSITETVDQMCSDNSATSEELAAGMQETAATTVTVNDNIGMIKDGTEGLNKMASAGVRISEEVMKRAQDLREKTVEASGKTMNMYQHVKVKADQAIEGSKAVEKINALTQTIMEISSQTSLLALNASIEAARAGEAGRGFAVVATEIGGLADQTTQAIANIDEIVAEVNRAVAHMSDCLEETTGFLEHTVLNEYKEFERVSEQYREDADVFRDRMDRVRDEVQELTDSIEAIARAMNGINETVGESSTGIGNIAEKTSDMVQKTGSTHSMVSDCFQSVERLQEIVKQFVLE